MLFEIVETDCAPMIAPLLHCMIILSLTLSLPIFSGTLTTFLPMDVSVSGSSSDPVSPDTDPAISLDPAVSLEPAVSLDPSVSSDRAVIISASSVDSVDHAISSHTVSSHTDTTTSMDSLDSADSPDGAVVVSKDASTDSLDSVDSPDGVAVVSKDSSSSDTVNRLIRRLFVGKHQGYFFGGLFITSIVMLAIIIFELGTYLCRK